MDETFESVFVVEATPAKAWQRLVDARPDGGDGAAWWLPGFDGTGTEVEVEAGRRLVVVKDHMPCEATTVSIELVDRGGDTEVSVVQKDFEPGFVAMAGEAFPVVCNQIEADLRLYLERGVHGGRHGRPWALLGFEVLQTPAAVEVCAVHDGTYAGRAAVEVGDLLLTLAGAPVVDHRDLTTLCRVLVPGETVSSTWVRGTERREVSAQV